MPFYQLVSIIGSVLLLTAYGGLQIGVLNARTSYLYQFFNLFGAACLTYSVIEPFNSGVFITESVWTIFSVIGLVKLFGIRRDNRQAAALGEPSEAARPTD